MKRETTDTLAGPEFSSVGKSRRKIIPAHHSLLRNISPSAEFILSICLFLLMMGLMTYLIQHLILFIENLFLERSNPPVEIDHPVSRSLYLYFLLFAIRPNHVR